MYEQFCNDVIKELSEQLTDEQLKLVIRAMDKVSPAYSFSKACTELSIPGQKELMETISMYIVIRRGEGLAKSSEKTMCYVLRAWARECTAPLNQLTANMIRAWLYNYQDRHGTSPRSMDLYRTVVVTFLKWCASEGYLEKDITTTIKKIKFVRRHRKALSQLQLEQVRHACQSDREKCVVEVLYSTGCRVS